MNWITRILDFISPRLCVVCGQRLAPTERSLCSVCLFHLPRTDFHQKPLDNPMAQLFWGLAPVEKAAALFYYHPHSETAQLVYRLKYNNRPDIGEDMGRVMACELQATDFFSDIDVLLPVPLASKRLRQRGYNQSEQLAIGISDITHLPIVTKALRRKHFQQSQTTLNRWQRQENVEDTFWLKDGSQLQDKHVLLIDDICTTGATLISCANTLKDIEGIRISVLTLGFTKD
jgi:ComF family protein